MIPSLNKNDASQLCLATLALCLVLVIVYAIFGPVVSYRPSGTYWEALLGVFLHASPMHLAGNLIFIYFGGHFAEPRLGSLNTVYLLITCAVIGTFTQYIIFGPQFIGASGLAYGLLAYGVITGRELFGRLLATAAMVVLIGLEFLFHSQTVAILVHAAGAFVGGSLAMFESLFGSKEPKLKPMQHTHITQVVGIIEQTDEDDAAEAEAGFLESGVDNMFVYAAGSQVMGVAGFSPDEQVDDVAWLSWVYLDEEHHGQGHGGAMLNDLLGKLDGMGFRKIFIATSDYKEDGKLIYAAAHKMYEDFGAEVEMTIADFHAEGEAKIVYGLMNPRFNETEPMELNGDKGFAVTGSGIEPETEDISALIWEETPEGVSGLDFALRKVSELGSRKVVLTIPSDMSDANSEMIESQNFENAGTLKDYYAPECHQIWWLNPLNNQTSSKN